MDSGAEADVGVRIPADVHAIGLREDRLVSVRRAQQGRDLLTRLYGDAADVSVSSRRALEEMQRRVVSQKLLDCVRRGHPRVGNNSRKLPWVAEQPHQSVAESV